MFGDFTEGDYIPVVTFKIVRGEIFQTSNWMCTSRDLICQVTGFVIIYVYMVIGVVALDHLLTRCNKLELKLRVPREMINSVSFNGIGLESLYCGGLRQLFFLSPGWWVRNYCFTLYRIGSDLHIVEVLGNYYFCPQEDGSGIASLL